MHLARLLPWLVAALILFSAAFELLRGRARVRGIGVYVRRLEPRRYWLVVELKLALAAFGERRMVVVDLAACDEDPLALTLRGP